MAAKGDRYDRLIAEIQNEFEKFRIVRKDRSRFQRAIHYGLVAVTLGGMRRYVDRYQTTIGQTVYVTPDWDDRPADERYVIMCHERVHLRQFRRLTLVGMAVLYLLVPLPMGAAYFRARFEREAYAETLRAAVEVYGVDHVRDDCFRRAIIGQFLGPAYGWMWPFRGAVERWYDGVVAKLAGDLGRA